MALQDAKNHGFDVKGSTVYVTLEPCCHFGKTPPCTLALVQANVAKVIIAAGDPNPLAS
jgi:diaminohydroxyphosphoribosylaminopyrimidine deaminase/5-amino-6-(5-phosphoribosylamino)uracil reductase